MFILTIFLVPQVKKLKSPMLFNYLHDSLQFSLVLFKPELTLLFPSLLIFLLLIDYTIILNFVT